MDLDFIMRSRNQTYTVKKNKNSNNALSELANSVFLCWLNSASYISGIGKVSCLKFSQGICLSVPNPELINSLN